MEIKLRELYDKISGTKNEKIDLSRLSSLKRVRFIAQAKKIGISANELIESSKDERDYIDNLPKQIKNSELSKLENLSIGVDIQLIAEIEGMLCDDPKSNDEIKAIFSLSEIAYAETKPNLASTLAGLFAAKEAILKTGYLRDSVINFNEIIIRHDTHGQPHFEGINLSISHDGEYAVSVASPTFYTAQLTEVQNQTNTNEKIHKPKQGYIIFYCISLLITYSWLLLLSLELYS